MRFFKVILNNCILFLGVQQEEVEEEQIIPLPDFIESKKKMLITYTLSIKQKEF